MRYDLEIPPESFGMIFVEQGKDIPSSAVPILYTNVNESNIVPKDLIEIELASKFKSYSNVPIQQTSLGEFAIESNKILITTVSRFSKITGTRTPVFFRHIIKLDLGQTILDQSVKIFNEFNIQLDSELFVIESASDEVYVYMNHMDNAILSIEYADQKGLYREMLKLEPAFKDMSSNFLDAGSLTSYEFAVVTLPDGTFKVFTNNLSPKFIASKKDFSSVSHPVGNINGSWYLRFDNITVNSLDASGANVKYKLIEYSIQRLYDAFNDPDFSPLYKIYKEQISKVINNNYVQLQSIPHKDKIGEVDILIKDKASNSLVYAFTTNQSTSKINTSITGVVWSRVDDYNYDGIFKLPVNIDKDRYSVYATYYADNNFYEYRTLDMNAIDASSARMIAIYITPYNSNDALAQNSIFFAFIGKEDNRANTDKFKSNGCGFETKQEYINFLTERSSINLCYTSVSTDKLYDLLDITYCGSQEEMIVDELSVAKQDLDLFKRDSLNGEIRLSLNDVVYSNIDSSIFTGDINKDDEYIKFAKNIISKNVCPSSSVILGKNLIN